MKLIIFHTRNSIGIVSADATRYSRVPLNKTRRLPQYSVRCSKTIKGTFHKLLASRLRLMQQHQTSARNFSSPPLRKKAAAALRILLLMATPVIRGGEKNQTHSSLFYIEERLLAAPLRHQPRPLASLARECREFSLICTRGLAGLSTTRLLESSRWRRSLSGGGDRKRRPPHAGGRLSASYLKTTDLPHFLSFYVSKSVGEADQDTFFKDISIFSLWDICT